uniref:Murine leukemia virus integrase C-terminal domain-containing protein n=1 Tax=Gadus morhua TaxID=8049 RepID=A0A8C5CYF6_GADMO
MVLQGPKTVQSNLLPVPSLNDSLNPNFLLPRWQGPIQVLLTTRTAVKLQGKPEWIHASRSRPGPPEEESTNASDGPPLPNCIHSPCTLKHIPSPLLTERG